MEERIQKILDSFNFEKVLIYAQATKLRYEGYDEITIPLLQNTLRSILIDIINTGNEIVTIDLGGFLVFKLQDIITVAFPVTVLEEDEI